MTYDQLLTLDAIVKAGSFKAASEKLFKSQPSISIAIKKLEEEFQLEIFSRAQYRPKLTEEGQAFYEKAKIAIFHMQTLNALGEELAMGTESEINVSVDLICPKRFIFCNLREFFQDHSTTNLNLDMDIINGTYEKLITGDAQIGFMPIGPDFKNIKDFEYYPVAKVEMIPVMAKYLHDKNIVDLESLRKIPQIVISSTGKDKDKSYGLLEGGRKWYVNDISTKKDIILSGLGWGHLPNHSIEKELELGELKAISIPSFVSFIGTIYMIRNIHKPLGPISKELWEKFKKLSFEAE